jgi:hypothetical protein
LPADLRLVSAEELKSRAKLGGAAPGPNQAPFGGALPAGGPAQHPEPARLSFLSGLHQAAVPSLCGQLFDGTRHRSVRRPGERQLDLEYLQAGVGRVVFVVYPDFAAGAGPLRTATAASISGKTRKRAGAGSPAGGSATGNASATVTPSPCSNS